MMRTDAGVSPSKAVTGLLEALRVRRSREVARSIDQLEYDLHRIDELSARAAIQRLLNETASEFGVASGEQIASVVNNEFLSDSIDAIREICDRLISTERERSKTRSASIVQEMKRYIERNFDNPALNTEMVAAHFGVSAGYVGKLFRRFSSETFGHFLNKTRIVRAADQLVSSDRTVSEISRSVGIENESYFFTLFRKHFGETPARYRNRRTPTRET
jgi:YesN/AraC family two-component response regulator